MKFDKSKVYTAVNADEVKIGSKCFYERSLKYLKEDVENNNEQDIGIVTEIYDESQIYRFQIDYWIDRQEISDGAFALIYLIEPPTEPKYKPFSSDEKAMEAMQKHGGWVKHKRSGILFFITGIDIGTQSGEEIYIARDWFSACDVLGTFVFADDGSPCGELAEE